MNACFLTEKWVKVLRTTTQKDYRAPDSKISEPIPDYDCCLAIQVTNGISSKNIEKKAWQATAAAQQLPNDRDNISVYSAMMFVHNYSHIDCNTPPMKDVDILLRMPHYAPFLHSIAVARAMKMQKPNGRGPLLKKRYQWMLHQMQRANYNRGIPLEHFFLNEGPELKNAVDTTFPRQYKGNVPRYLMDFSNVKGLVVEQYVAVLFDLYMPQKEISYRHRIVIQPERGPSTETDIDIVVACKTEQFVAVVEEHQDLKNIEVLKLPLLKRQPRCERRRGQSLASLLAGV
jgi:hypothetical protein